MDTFCSVTAVEHRVSESEDVLHDHAASLHTFKMRVNFLESRGEDAKNRNRRNNLCIVGLTEGAGGTDPTTFSEWLLHSLLSQTPFSAHFMVKRVQRMSAARPRMGGPPRILKFLNFRDRDLVMREARKINVVEL